MPLGDGHLDYYAFTQPTFNNSIESGMVYEAFLPEQKKDIADNKKLYKSSRLASNAKLLFSFGFVRVNNYQSVIGHEAKSSLNDNKIDYSENCLSTDSENN